MKPKKFRKICKKYFTDSNFTIETYTDENDNVAISVFYCGYGILRYCSSNNEKSNEKPYILLADKFKYSDEVHGRILPCRNDGTFIGLWLDYTKLYNVGHNQLIKIILNIIEKIKVAKVEYKKHLIEKDFV